MQTNAQSYIMCLLWPLPSTLSSTTIHSRHSHTMHTWQQVERNTQTHARTPNMLAAAVQWTLAAHTHAHKQGRGGLSPCKPVGPAAICVAHTLSCCWCAAQHTHATRLQCVGVFLHSRVCCHDKHVPGAGQICGLWPRQLRHRHVKAVCRQQLQARRRRRAGAAAAAGVFVCAIPKLLVQEQPADLQRIRGGGGGQQ